MSMLENAASIFRAEVPWRWTQYIPSKHWYLPTSPHDVTTQEINVDILTAAGT
jgi:hypothetical protein